MLAQTNSPEFGEYDFSGCGRTLLCSKCRALEYIPNAVESLQSLTVRCAAVNACTVSALKQTSCTPLVDTVGVQ